MRERLDVAEGCRYYPQCKEIKAISAFGRNGGRRAALPEPPPPVLQPGDGGEQGDVLPSTEFYWVSDAGDAPRAVQGLHAPEQDRAARSGVDTRLLALQSPAPRAHRVWPPPV